MTAGFQALAIQIPMERDRGVLKRFLGTPMPKRVYFAGKVQMVAFIAVLETVVLLTVATLLFGLKLPSTVDVSGPARGLPTGLVRRPRARRLLRPAQGRAGAGHLVRSRLRPLPHHIPLDHDG
jgi:hypothetical protein